MSEQVQKLFNSIAPRYDLLNGLLSLRTDKRWRRLAVGRLKGSRFHRVLDLCAGTLGLTRALLEINDECRVTALDFSEPMLRKGWEQIPARLRKRIDVVVGDAMTMEIPPPPPLTKGGQGGFDAVMCAYGMRNIDDNSLVLRKIRKILRPGGRLVVLELFRPDGLLSRLFHVTYAQFIIPALGKIVSGHPLAYRYLRDSVRGYFTPRAFRELLRESGFEKIKMYPLTGGVSHLVTAKVASRDTSLATARSGRQVAK